MPLISFSYRKEQRRRALQLERLERLPSGIVAVGYLEVGDRAGFILLRDELQFYCRLSENLSLRTVWSNAVHLKLIA